MLLSFSASHMIKDYNLKVFSSGYCQPAGIVTCGHSLQQQMKGVREGVTGRGYSNKVVHLWINSDYLTIPLILEQ